MTVHRPKLRTAAERANGTRLPRVNLRVTHEMARRLKEKARQENRSVNGIVRRAIMRLFKGE
jgi:predicted HicB family RNase H-like nuclease